MNNILKHECGCVLKTKTKTKPPKWLYLQNGPFPRFGLWAKYTLFLSLCQLLVLHDIQLSPKKTLSLKNCTLSNLNSLDFFKISKSIYSFFKCSFLNIVVCPPNLHAPTVFLLHYIICDCQMFSTLLLELAISSSIYHSDTYTLPTAKTRKSGRISALSVSASSFLSTLRDNCISKFTNSQFSVCRMFHAWYSLHLTLTGICLSFPALFLFQIFTLFDVSHPNTTFSPEASDLVFKS